MSVNTILSSKISDTGSEPVSVEQAKLHAAIDYTDYDSILPIYLSAARQSIEKATGQALVSKKVNLTVALYAGNVFKLPHSPVNSVNYIVQTFPVQNVILEPNEQSNVGVNSDFVVIDLDGIYDIEYECSITSVSADMKLAVLQMFAFIFNHRGEYMEGKLDYAVEAERIIGQNTRFVI